MTTAVTTHSRVLVLTGGEEQHEQLPVQFAFDDTSFMYEGSLKSTWGILL